MNTKTQASVPVDRRAVAAVAAALAIACAALPARAGAGEPAPRASRPESVGVASGFAVGAAAGGPVGALLGAAAGGWFGDRLHRERSVHARTVADLAVAERRTEGLTMHLMFRTDEAAPRAEDEQLLQQFATLAKGTPGASVQVTGFADPRGTPRHNAALAAARAAEVAARLVAAGVAADRLVVSSETAAQLPDTGSGVAAGPAVAGTTSPDLDGYAFQRRVTLRIVAVDGEGHGGSEGTLAQRR